MSGGVIMTTMQAYENEQDFSEWLTGLVAGVAAHVGGSYELTAGRPGFMGVGTDHRMDAVRRL